jgi:type II secretory pathway component HofQ
MFSWQRALDVVLRTYGYVYERDENIIRVTTRENLALEPVVTKTFVLNYSKAPEIQEAVRDMLTERGRIKIAERMNMLVITDIPTNVYTIAEVVEKTR